jgi:hypothetical protein
MPKPKRGEPELLLVSFCDIVTITTCAMFMAMIIVIDESMKIPVVSPVPVLHYTTNAPVYYECRDNMVFMIDLASLEQTFTKYSTEFKKAGGGSELEKLMALDAGDATYRIDPALATMGVLGLRPKPGVRGVPLDSLTNILDRVGTPFVKSLLNINTGTQYCVFFVRDSGFNIFRTCRAIVVDKKFRHGWELLGRDEPITFEGMMHSPGFQ